MARTSAEEQRARRRKRLTRGLLLGSAALGLPALYNLWIARRARTLALPTWGRPDFVQSPLGLVACRKLSADAPGTPLLLLHSLAPGHSSSHWQAVAQRAATRRPVLVMDWPGWGESSRARLDYGPEGLAASLVDVLRANEFTEPATVVAAGLACVPVFEWARSSPTELRDLVLVCPRSSGDDRPAVRDRLLGLLLEVPVLGTSAVHIATSRRALESQLESALAEPGRIPHQWIDEHERFSHLPGSRHPLTAYFTGKFERNVLDDFENLERPVHLVWGRRARNPEISEADLWLRRRDVPLHVLEDAGSLPHLEVPEALVRVLPD